MRTRLLSFAIAACMATPIAFAQGQGGGQGGGTAGAGTGNPNPHGSMSGSMQDGVDRSSLGQDTSARAQQLRDATADERSQFGSDQAAAAQARDVDYPAEPTTDNTTGSDASAFGQDTAARAKEQKEADAETRREFGEDQSTRAKDQGNDGAEDDADDSDTADDEGGG